MKRVCSLLLAFALLLSVAQPTALAAELDAADEAAVVAAAEAEAASDEEEADDAEEEQEEASETAEEAEPEAAEEETPAAVDEETPAAADETTANEEETSTTADEAADDEEEASTAADEAADDEAETSTAADEAADDEEEASTTADEEDVTVSAAYVDDDGSLTLELSEGIPADGTYTGAATVEPDEYEDFDAYEVQIAFTFADGVLTGSELVSTVDEDNESYFNRAFSTGRGKISSIIEQLKGSTTTVDVVSNATCSSKGIVAAYEDAYAQAVAANTSGEEETEYVYVSMNVPYADFYAELNDDGDVDTVTSATTSKAANCKNVYLTVDSDAGTTSIYGVVVPVKMSAATYKAVADLVTDSTAAYYVGEAVEDPAVYLELTYEDGAYTFSDIQGTVTATTVSDTTLSTTSVWGDYELDLDADYGIATTEVYGAYVTTTDGAQYAMKQSENLWTPSKYYEAAWDTIDNAYYSSMEGKTIESVTFVTTSGLVVYTLDESLYVQEHMSSVPKVEFTSSITLAISNLAEDAADVSVTVKASGKNGASLTDEGKTVVDGAVTLDTAATDGTTYQVTITSSNYAANIVNATFAETYVYAYMNVPYADFYAELNDDGDVDTVTSATTSKAANCKNVYLTVDSDAGTTSIYGVVVPVKMSAATYAAIANLVTDSTAAYYVGETVEDPAVYLDLTYEDGAYTFSAIQGTVTATTVSDTTLSTTSVWGDYELDLDADYGIATTEVYGAYVTTTDGAQYAMKQSENLWTPSKYYEAAWDTIDNAYYSSMECKTIESVTFVTTSGLVVYTLDESLYVQEHMSDVPTAEFTSATTLTISNLADDAENVTVTVKASGRNGAYLTDEAVSLVDGVATLDTAATDGTTYQVTISSDNYASNIVNATFAETYVYAYMNVPYADFYAGLNDDGDVDTVTSATTSKAANCKNVYLTVDSDAGTTSIYGVVVPVKMSATTYKAIANLVTDSTAAYYVGETVEDPAVYLELTYEDGAYTFSAIQGTVTATTVSDTTLSTTSVWGDYELDLDADYGIATTDVYGAYFTTTDGTQYAMKQSENLWTPSKYYEAAWDTIDNDYYSSMEGKTIESVTFVTTSGIVEYTLSEALYVTPHMATTPAAEFTSGTTLTISNLAEDAENVTVTVKASGRNGTYLTDEAVSVVDGVATLDTAATDGTTYQVTVSSDNYASNIVTATYVAQDYYVLMNIPYDEFYAADVNNDVAVDAFTSATKAKTQTWSLSGGSYHVSEDGSDITGVTFPVKVPKGTDLSAYTQITDDDSLEITVTNRGTTSTTTYTGSQALYQADSYSYYVLSSDPSYYKELTVNEDGSFSFGAVVGESTAVTGSAELTTDTSYGDYQLSVDGITDYVTAGTDDVYGVVLHTEEGSDYGLRHLENIWRVSELAFCTGFTTAVHNCPTSSAHYEAIMGQTITGITYYTSAGIYEVTLSESVYVPTKSDVTVSVEDAYVLDGQTTFTVDGTLADDFEAAYSVDIEGAVVDAENGTITFATDTDLADYTLTISDESGKYDDITASFSLYNYYYMNVPYSVFYSELNDDGDVDVVTSATTSKAANCNNVYMTVDSDAGTTTIYGVVVPVKVSGSSYASVKDLVTDSAADYYVGDALESAPTVYLELTYNSRTGYSFSSIQSTAEATTATVDATLSSSSVWGDYELDLDSDYGIATTEVYGAYVTTDDGAQYAMKQSENLWTPSKYYEAAWDTIGSDYYASMEGKTITGVTFITTSGIKEYTLSEALYVTPHMATTPAAEFTSGTTLAITGVAEDAENVTVTVKASGRNGASLTDEAKSIVDGVVTLDTAATDGTTYQVTISSDTYASNIVTAVYSVDTAALTAAIEQANALTEGDYTADSWAAMQTALADAATLAEATTGKTQAEVDEITAALTVAIDSLVNITALTAAVETAQALTESSYTADSWAVMQSALADATTLAEATTGKTQAEVDEITAALTAAINGLVNITALTAAVETAQALTESSYTTDSWADLETALSAAQTVVANDSATQTEVDEAASALTAAVAALVDTSALTAAIAKAEALTESSYTASTWAAMQTALTSAKSVLSDADQTQVDEAASALTAAVDALVAVDEGDEDTSTSSGDGSTDSSTSSDGSSSSSSTSSDGSSTDSSTSSDGSSTSGSTSSDGSSSSSSTSSDGSSSSSSTSSDGSSSSSSTSSDGSSSSSSTSSDDSSAGSSSSSSTSSPKTGDASQMMLWVILLAGSATGLVINFRRKRTDNAE